jgi:hypothetical protein
MDLQYFGERSTQLLTTFSEQEKHDKLYNQPPAARTAQVRSSLDRQALIRFSGHLPKGGDDVDHGRTARRHQPVAALPRSSTRRLCGSVNSIDTSS